MDYDTDNLMVANYYNFETDFNKKGNWGKLALEFSEREYSRQYQVLSRARGSKLKTAVKKWTS